MAVIGRCKLCLRDRIGLRESHFIPKSAYKIIEKVSGVTPLSVRGAITVQKNEQMKAHILCAACEDLFNKNGEGWVMQYCNRPEGFKLHSILQALTPHIDVPDLKMYDTSSIPEIDAAKMAYFLLSVLWRGSVHRWRWGRDEQDTDYLGKRYEEEFRQYLLGVAPFPQNVAVHVFILSNPGNWIGCTVPFRQKLHDGIWGYTFTFLGFSFRAFLGNALDAVTRSGCVRRSPQKYIFLGTKVDDVLVRDFGPTLVKSKELGKIRR